MFSGSPSSCLLLISSALCVQIETARSPRVIVEEVGKLVFSLQNSIWFFFKWFANCLLRPMSGTLTPPLHWIGLTTMATRAPAWWSNSWRRGRSRSSWRTSTTTSSSSRIAPRLLSPGFHISQLFFVFQAETASEGQSEHLVDLPQVRLLWYFDILILWYSDILRQVSLLWYFDLVFSSTRVISKWWCVLKSGLRTCET